MGATEIEAVRRKGGDQPIRHQESKTGDGVSTPFQLQVFPIETTPAIRVWVNNILKVVTTDYTVDAAEGIVTFLAAPAAGDAIRFEYTAAVWSDTELQLFIDEAGNSTTLATVYMLLALAASAARLAKKETLAGGGGLGAVTLDTAVRAKELRDTAKAYYDQYAKDEGAGVPYEELTEIAWTPFQAMDMVEDQILRRL